MFKVEIPTEIDRQSASRLLWKSFFVLEEYKESPYWYTPPKNHALVVKDGEEVVSTMSFATHFENTIRGVNLPLAGIWGVATVPAYRRRGMVRAIFDKGFKMMKEEGMVISVLNPASVVLYEKLGYANAERRLEHIIQPGLFKSVQCPNDIKIRELKDSEKNNYDQIYKSMSRFGSRVYSPELKGEHIYLIEQGNEPVGIVMFRFMKNDQGRDLYVITPVYTKNEVFPVIIDFVNKFSEECSKIHWISESTAPVEYFVKERIEIESKQIGSMMIRIIDFEEYCKRIKIPKKATEQVLVQIIDKHCPWNNSIYRLIPQNGCLEVNRLEEHNEIKPEIVLSEFQLSQIVSGLTPASMLFNYGEIQCDKKTAQKLEAIFPEEDFLSYIRF